MKTRENRVSLTRWKKKKIEFCRCRHRCLFVCNQFQPFSQSNREGVSSSLTNAKNHTFLSFFLSRISPIVANKQISNLFPHFSFSTILKWKRRKKAKQIQNILCKCGWDFDHFDQFDQNHAFSNHNPKRMTIGFVLRELLTIIKHCKNEKQNEWSWNFISFLVCFHHCRKERKKERKECQNHFHPSTNNFHSFSLIQYHQTNQTNHNQTTMRMRRGKGENEHHQQPSNKSKPHRLTRAWREGENKLHSPNYPLFQHSVSAMNTRSPPMRIDTPQVIRADRDLSHWCFRRQFNRAMSESGVHDKRKYPTRWEMTIHYTANDYSLFKAKQSLQEKAK